MEKLDIALWYFVLVARHSHDCRCIRWLSSTLSNVVVFLNSAFTLSCTPSISGEGQFDETYEWPTLFEEADEMLQGECCHKPKQKLFLKQPCLSPIPSSIFLHTMDLYAASLLMYLFTKLRLLAREGKLKNAGRLLQTPIEAMHAFELIEENADVLKEQIGDEDVRQVQSALKSMHERYKRLQQTEASSQTYYDMFHSALNEWWEKNGTKGGPRIQPPPTSLVAFCDDNCHEALVYAVALDK